MLTSLLTGFLSDGQIVDQMDYMVKLLYLFVTVTTLPVAMIAKHVVRESYSWRSFIFTLMAKNVLKTLINRMTLIN